MPTIGTGFSDYIDTRQSAVNPSVTEYFNKQTKQGFANAGEVAAYASTLNSGKAITPDNVFGVLEQGFTSTLAPKPISATTPPNGVSVPELPKPTAADVGTNFVTSATADLEAKRKTLEDTYKSQLEQIKTQQTQYQKQIDELTAKQDQTITQDIQPLLQPFRQQLETSERDRLKVEENFFANQKLTDELSTLLTQGNDLIAKAEKENVPLIFRNANVGKIMSDIAARAGVIQAVMSARNNQITQAYTLIDRSVEATVADRKDQLNYYSTLLDFYQNQKDEAGNKLLNLDKKEQQYISAQIGLLENDLANAQKTADYVKSLMVDPETAKFVADAGITLNDSIETINQKMAEQTQRVQMQAEQKANRDEAFKAGITSQFYNKQGAIIRTSDGFVFKDPAQFQQMTGMSLQEAESKGLIQKLTGASTQTAKFTKIGTDDFGNDIYGFVNETTQKVTPIGGGNLSFDPNATGMRTDRHNNPTAFTTDIAKLAGLVEGVDYVQGDAFPNNPNLHTAKLLGDPIATTIKVIDKIGFYTASGKPRWTYVDSIPNAKNWNNLDYNGKAAVIAQMYQHEGGNGSLLTGDANYKPQPGDPNFIGPVYPGTQPPQRTQPQVDVKSQLPLQLQSALQTVSGKQFFDLGLVTSDEQPVLRKYAATYNIPVLTKQDADKVRSTVAAAEQAKALVGQIQDLAKKVEFAPDRLSKWGWTIGNYLKKATGDKDVNLYTAKVDSMLSILSRATGEKGVLTDQDVARIKNGLPTLSDTNDIASSKIAGFTELFNNIVNSSLNTYLPSSQGVDLRQFDGSLDLSQFER